ncbi:MAG TPA: hypothetical protein VHC47_12360, partial [Mucilaginibacter sp.]|nr:hypothetical protein [Mucilaginibacter sp.]
MKLEFDNSTGAMITSLDRMLEYISGTIPPHADADDILFRCKVIVTELLTNAIKHAGDGSTLFGIERDSEQLVIQKSDKGAPLYLINNRHLHGDDEKKLI